MPASFAAGARSLALAYEIASDGIEQAGPLEQTFS
jgi:hypothetical protein